MICFSVSSFSVVFQGLYSLAWSLFLSFIRLWSVETFHWTITAIFIFFMPAPFGLVTYFSLPSSFGLSPSSVGSRFSNGGVWDFATFSGPIYLSLLSLLGLRRFLPKLFFSLVVESKMFSVHGEREDILLMNFSRNSVKSSVNRVPLSSHLFSSFFEYVLQAVAYEAPLNT